MTETLEICGEVVHPTRQTDGKCAVRIHCDGREYFAEFWADAEAEAFANRPDLRAEVVTKLGTGAWKVEVLARIEDHPVITSLAPQSYRSPAPDASQFRS